MSSVDKIYTDYIPLLDEIVYNLKRICKDIIIKDENIANSYEYEKSVKASDLYILCIENNAKFEFFSFTKQDYIDIGIPENILDKCLKNPDNIPERFKNALVKKKSENYINNYVEYNNYYRMLNGLPDYGVDPIYLTEDLYAQIPEGYNVDINIPIHEMDKTSQELLVQLGIADQLYDKYKQKYLKYIGAKSIDFYTARKAVNFQLLYIPKDIPKEVYTRFLDKYELNRNYILQTVYSDAFKYGSDNYDDFIKLLIIVSTMVDIIAQMPDFIIKRDIFDSKMVQLMFESSGIDYYYEIPFKYQLAMVKNMNRLIKFKGTTQSIVDICSLFGCDNIQIFKYYILKDRRKDKDGNYINKYVLDEDGNPKEDLDANYELKFLKVPIEDMADNYIYDKTKYFNYDEMTAVDKYWDGGADHNEVKKTILEHEFNYMNSKYISVDTLYSLSDMAFQQMYFYNMIFDDVEVEKRLTLKVPTIDSLATFTLPNILCYLFALMYIDYGIKDSIFSSATKILSIKGFNFKADMAKLAEYINEKGYTLKDLGIDDYQMQSTDILSYNRLVEIFTKNTKIYKHVVHEMLNANNKDIYDIYKKIYDSLMLRDLTNDFFQLEDKTIAPTYTDYLKEKDIILYNSLQEIRGITNPEVKQTKINNIISDTIYILEEYLNMTDFKYIFSQFPTVSAESIKQYLFKVIGFFKSYKIQIHSINTIYKFDDQLENKIMIIDQIRLKYVFTKQDTIELIEKLYSTITTTKKDYVTIQEELYKEIFHQIDLYMDNKPNIIDSIIRKRVNFEKEETIDFHELAELLIHLEENETIELVDKLYSNISIKKKENISIKEIVYNNVYHQLERMIPEEYKAKDIFNRLRVDTTKNENICISEDIAINPFTT